MSRSLLLFVLVGSICVCGTARAQVHWTVDSKRSLGWWQVSPNLNHLWATTCPSDSGWRPGEGRSSGWFINKNLKLPRHGYANVDDTVHVPLYPRKKVMPVCQEAMRGEIVAPDTINWRHISGTIALRGDALITGENMRDALTRDALQTSQFPEVYFNVDSVINVTKLPGDTIKADAIGNLVVRGQPKPSLARLKAFKDGGGMRVLAKIRFPARDLVRMTPKLHTMGLGVNTNIWHDFFVGADIVLRPGNAGAGGTQSSGQ